MLKSDKFFVKSDSLKVETNFSMMDHVVSLIRNAELNKALSKKSFKDGKKILEKSFVGVDPMEIDDSRIYTALKTDGGQWIKDRQEILDLQAEVNDCIPLDQVTTLSPVDRVHVTLMAHAIYKNVTLDKDLFDPDKGGVEIGNLIRKYYTNGSIKDVKTTLTAVFNKLLGVEGDYFYPVKIRKSSFSDADLRNFFAPFGGMASRETIKRKDDKGKEVKTFGNFDYIDKSENIDLQVKAFTTLCAVVLDCENKHEVIRPAQSEISDKEKDC